MGIGTRCEMPVEVRVIPGVQLVNGHWRYSDTKIIETDLRGPGADQQPTGRTKPRARSGLYRMRLNIAGVRP